MDETPVAHRDGVTLRSSPEDRFADLRDTLADAARDGDRRTVPNVLDAQPAWSGCARRTSPRRGSIRTA